MKTGVSQILFCQTSVNLNNYLYSDETVADIFIVKYCSWYVNDQRTLLRKHIIHISSHWSEKVFYVMKVRQGNISQTCSAIYSH